MDDKQKTYIAIDLKSYGIPGRARLFEVVQKVKDANRARLVKAPGRRFTGSSYLSTELAKHPELEIAYLIAPPRMAFYMEYSTIIYNIYPIVLMLVKPAQYCCRCHLFRVRIGDQAAFAAAVSPP